MEKVISAIYEAAMIFSAGIPLRDTYDHLCDLYASDQDVLKLFEDLKQDWDSPNGKHPLKVVGPFLDRESQNQDYLICAGFSEVGAMTTMMDRAWKDCGYAYLLKRKISQQQASDMDIAFAKNLMSFFSSDHPLIKYMFSFKAGPLWTYETVISSPENPAVDFKTWASQLSVKMGQYPFRLKPYYEKAAQASGYMPDLEFLSEEWILFCSVLFSAPAVIQK